MNENIGFWIIQAPGWVLFLYLLIAQCPAAFSYRIGVRMGSQEPSEKVTEVGAAFWWGLALADLIFYTPVLGLGLIGHLTEYNWAPLVLGAAFGITVYWPIVCLATIRSARSAKGWDLPKERQYWVLLPIISLWGICGLVVLLQ